MKAVCSILLTDPHAKLTGLDLIREIQQRRLPVTIIVTTGHGSVDEAVQAIHLGACDFLTTPVDIDYLRLVIDRGSVSGPCKMKWQHCGPS